MAAIWIIKSRHALAYVRDRYQGQPVMTGVLAEAEQFPTRDAALEAVRAFAPDRIAMDVVESAAVTREIHGQEPGGMRATPPR